MSMPVDQAQVQAGIRGGGIMRQQSSFGSQFSDALTTKAKVQHENENDDPVQGRGLNGLTPTEEDVRVASSSSIQAVNETRTFPNRNAWATLFFQEIAHDKMLEAQIMVLTIATGIVDAMTYTTYSVFVSKQTGNTLFVALYALRNDNVQGLESNIGVSLGFFLAGAAFFGHIGHRVKQRRRIWLIVSNMVQTAMVYGATAIQWWGHAEKTGDKAVGAIALLAFACGGQIALALHAGLAELNTTMITGALIQLATDPRLFSLRNIGRNRKVLFFLSLLTGCFIGSAATTCVDPALALLLMAITKTLVGVSFFFNHGVVARPEGDKEAGEIPTPFHHILWGD